MRDETGISPFQFASIRNCPKSKQRVLSGTAEGICKNLSYNFADIRREVRSARGSEFIYDYWLWTVERRGPSGLVTPRARDCRTEGPTV